LIYKSLINLKCCNKKYSDKYGDTWKNAVLSRVGVKFINLLLYQIHFTGSGQILATLSSFFWLALLARGFSIKILQFGFKKFSLIMTSSKSSFNELGTNDKKYSDKDGDTWNNAVFSRIGTNFINL